MTSLRQEIIAQKGSQQAMDDQQFLTILFKALSSTTNPDFNLEVKNEKSRWLRNKSVDVNQTISNLNTVYKNMVAERTWDQVDERKQQIIALTSQIKKLKSKTKSHQTKTNTPSSDKKFKVPTWRIKNVGPATKDPDSGSKFVWCPHHKSKDGMVNGMYIPDGHNHEEWLEKKQKQRNFLFKRRDKSSNNESNQSPNKKFRRNEKHPSKLALEKAFTSALTTRVQMGDKEAEETFNEMYIEALGTEDSNSLKD